MDDMIIIKSLEVSRVELDCPVMTFD